MPPTRTDSPGERRNGSEPCEGGRDAPAGRQVRQTVCAGCGKKVFTREDVPFGWRGKLCRRCTSLAGLLTEK